MEETELKELKDNLSNHLVLPDEYVGTDEKTVEFHNFPFRGIISIPNYKSSAFAFFIDLKIYSNSKLENTLILINEKAKYLGIKINLSSSINYQIVYIYTNLYKGKTLDAFFELSHILKLHLNTNENVKIKEIKIPEKIPIQIQAEYDSSEKKKKIQLQQKQLGRMAEECLFKELNNTFGPQNVKWLNQNKEDWKSYDFVVSSDSKNKFIECKGSYYPFKHFYLSANEWKTMLAKGDDYILYLVLFIEEHQKAEIIEITNFRTQLLSGVFVPYDPYRQRSIEKKTTCFYYEAIKIE